MGLIDLPTLEGYWNVMRVLFRRRDRFLQVFWMLNIGERKGRVDRVKVLCDALIIYFQRHYRPSQDMAVD